MRLAVFLPGRREIMVEVERADPGTGRDILALMSGSSLSAGALRAMASAASHEDYEIIGLGQYGINSLVLRQEVNRLYPREELLALLRTLAIADLLPRPLAGIRLLGALEERQTATEGSTGQTVGAVMQRELVWATPEETVATAARRMAERRVGCLPILNDQNLVGLVTSRDLRGVPPERLLRQVMRRNLISVAEGTPLWEAYRLMEESGVERILVTRGRKLLGLLTKRDLTDRLGYHTDPLTGLRTSPYLRAYAQYLLERGQEAAVIFFDLNNFGQINKAHGHVVGDRVLQSVGALFKEETQPATDLACRYGGDEFAILTTRSLVEAQELAHRLLAEISRLHFPEGTAVSACAGLAGGRRHAPRPQTSPAATVDDLINLASLASTRAKEEHVPLIVVAGETEREKA
ncbi:MAG: CBS domain-containing protein [Clostridia bacterium]|nr:CBS domain-containing protein [Clostridia bacterium]